MSISKALEGLENRKAFDKLKPLLRIALQVHRQVIFIYSRKQIKGNAG